MNYVAYKLSFPNGIHMGEGSLEDAAFTFSADTLFSAFCQESLKFQEGYLEKLYAKAKEGKICFSDGFPIIAHTFYLPKPMKKIEKEQIGNSILKKAFKKLEYIPAEKFEEYLKGDMDVEAEEKRFHEKLGASYVKDGVSIRGEEETRPYRVGVYRFAKESGIYFILGYEERADKEFVEELLEALSFSGIGGKRYSGLGRFDFFQKDLPQGIVERLKENGKEYMTLSISLPQESELEKILDNARYALVKRSGFVSSDTYAKEFLRKKDLFAFAAGACVKEKYEGDIYDVSASGTHPVYRYAKPLFMEVSI